MSLTKFIILGILSFFLTSCVGTNSIKKPEKPEKIYFSSKGFLLIYNEKLYQDKVVNKKIDNKEIIVMHNLLKRNTPIKIINPDNSKFIETKISKKANYPEIFNLLASKKIVEILELDENNPYVEIYETKKNKKFIAKESNTFDEEKNVAEKAPVDEISMNILSDTSVEKKKKNYIYTLVISDFFYYDSANNLKNELIKKTKVNKFSIKNVNNKYRLYVGPFKNFNSLKTIYISLNNLGFEGLNIYKEKE